MLTTVEKQVDPTVDAEIKTGEIFDKVKLVKMENNHATEPGKEDKVSSGEEGGENMTIVGWTLFRQGEKELHQDRHYEEAVEIFSQVLEILVPHYGQLAPELAPVYVAYGQALLQMAIQNRDALLNPEAITPEAMIDTIMSSEAGSSSKKKAKLVDLDSVIMEGVDEVQLGQETSEHDDESEQDGDKSKKDGGESKPDEDKGKHDGDESKHGNKNEENDDDDDDDTFEEDDDLQLANQVFDLARRIYADMASINPIAKESLAKVYCHLGDLAMEMEAFGEAAREFSHALELKEQIGNNGERDLASIYFKLAMALEYEGKVEEAMIPLKSAKSLIEQKIRYLEVKERESDGNLNDDKGKEPLLSGASFEKKSELKELKELLPDIDAKMDELKNNVIDSAGTIQKLGMAGELKDAFKDAAQSSIKDLSNLVKKRKPEL